MGDELLYQLYLFVVVLSHSSAPCILFFDEVTEGEGRGEEGSRGERRGG